MSITIEEKTDETRDNIREDLRKASVTKIVAEYNGYDDSGNVEEIKFSKENATTVILPSAEPRLTDFIWNFVQSVHSGCEIDAGSEGIFEWELDTDKISIRHEQRHISTESYVSHDL